MSGREIGRSVQISHVIANRALQNLSQHGVVKMRKIGRSILYSLNKEHILIREFLSPLFQNEKDLFSSLTKKILSRISDQKPISMVLFGSQVDGKQARPDSDFDILCIIPDESDLKKFKQDVSYTEFQIESEFGNRLSLYIMKKREYLQRSAKKDPLIQKIEQQHKRLFGKELREMK